ncbi:dynamin family protein [Corynebacterium sp. 20_84]
MVSISELLNRELEGLAAKSPEMYEACAPLLTRAKKPPRIVLTGRIKAGKSTLLNALVGAPVAETAALEATNVVTVYQYGQPARAEAQLIDGTRIPIHTYRGEVAALPAKPSEIAFIDRWMTSSAVGSYTLIDTPGLATLTEENESTTRAALIDGFEQTRNASVDADAAIFLFDSAPRTDEVEFLRDLGFTPLNTLGVLSRADSFGEGALGILDPIEEATRHAERLQREVSAYVGRVIPVSALLAETAATGALSESVTRDIAFATNRSRTSLVNSIYSDQPKDDLFRIIDLIGEFGLFRGNDAARRGAHGFNEWLTSVSGIGALRSVLERELSYFAYLHRAGVILRDLEALVYKHPEHSGDIRNALDAIRNHPAALPAKLLVTLKSLVAASASEEFIEEATRLASNGSPAVRLGLDGGATSWAVLDEIRVRREALQRRAFGLLDPSEEEAMVVFGQVYDQLERQAEAFT